jgi:regulator of nucleoside diphosphate kinase
VSHIQAQRSAFSFEHCSALSARRDERTLQNRLAPPTSLGPFVADATAVMLEPELAEHPDFHDGYGAMRMREIELEPPKQRPAPQLVVTTLDRARLRRLLSKRSGRGHIKVVEKLGTDLEDAQVVCPGCISPLVVTMNSTVIYEDQHTGARGQVKLVYPQQAPLSGARVSVLTPLGGALLGRSLGQYSGGPEHAARLRIVGVPYQPEAAARSGRASPRSPLVAV